MAMRLKALRQYTLSGRDEVRNEALIVMRFYILF